MFLKVVGKNSLKTENTAYSHFCFGVKKYTIVLMAVFSERL